jgi:hypothetical protein
MAGLRFRVEPSGRALRSKTKRGTVAGLRFGSSDARRVPGMVTRRDGGRPSLRRQIPDFFAEFGAVALTVRSSARPLATARRRSACPGDGFAFAASTSPRADAIAGILSSDDVRRFLVLAAFSLCSAAHVQEGRCAAVLAKASPKHRTWRTDVLKMPGMGPTPDPNPLIAQTDPWQRASAAPALLCPKPSPRGTFGCAGSLQATHRRARFLATQHPARGPAPRAGPQRATPRKRASKTEPSLERVFQEGKPPRARPETGHF